jgi:hypothetical protein
MPIGNPVTLTSNVASKTISAIATAGQTLFTVTGGYRLNYLAVYRNGTKLVESLDYTARDGNTITLISPSTIGDVLEFEIFDTFRVADAINANDDNVNFAGTVNIHGNLNVIGVTTIAGAATSVALATTAYGLTGSPNLVAGVVTATSFVGNVTGNATGLSGTPNIDVANITGSAATFTNLTVNGTQTIINTTSLEVADKNIGIGSTSSASDVTADGAGITVYGNTNKTLTYNNTKKAFETNIPWAPNETRIISGAEKVVRTSGNTINLTYNSELSSVVGYTTNPSGNITVNVNGIPTSSDFDDHSISFTVIVNSTGTARTCTAINFNGVSRTINWAGGSLSAALSGVNTTNGHTIFSFTGLNTAGSASTTTNYIVFGTVSGGFW